MTDNKRRYIIVTVGRTGSSLLAAILADAGADFGMSTVSDWNPKSGAYEHGLFWSAYAWHSRADKIDKSLIPNALGWQWAQHRSQSHLTELMEQADYAKYPGGGIWLVHQIAKLGYDVRVIVNYRDFAGYAKSRYLRFGWGIQRIVDTYLDVYGTALMQLQYFGGCTVDFAEIVDPSETAWLSALAQLTDLPEDKLIASQSERVKPRPASDPIPQLTNPLLQDARVQEMYDALRSLKGKVIAPE